MQWTKLVALIAIVSMVSLTVLAEPAPQSAAQGKALLAKGDLEGAMQAYRAAAQADPNNAEHAQQFAILRQAVEIRNRLESEQDAERFEYMGRALYAFYVGKGLYAPALELATKMHARLHSEISALLVAETAFALDKIDVVVKTLSSLEPSQVSPVTQALLGVALSRQGKADEARKIAKTVKLADDSAPPAVYAVARLQAATGDTKAALASLSRVFESLPPSRQDGYKEHAQQTAEFSALASTADFAKALATVSKVPESKCSGGSSCAGCPNRGKCNHGQQ